MAGTGQFTIGAGVRCTDGACGTLSRVVVDPVAREVTHLLVQPRQGHADAGEHKVPQTSRSATPPPIRLDASSAADRADQSRRSIRRRLPVHSAVTTDDHTAWPRFHGVFDPIAEYALIHRIPSGADATRRLSVMARSHVISVAVSWKIGP